jgi:hypothetical protein
VSGFAWEVPPTARRVSSPEGQLATWKSAPCAAEQAGIVLRGNESNSNATVLSVADFARLCMLLTQDEKVRCALIASEKNLSRTELDVGARRDDFWSTTVALRYNDSSLNVATRKSRIGRRAPKRL